MTFFCGQKTEISPAVWAPPPKGKMQIVHFVVENKISAHCDRWDFRRVAFHFSEIRLRLFDLLLIEPLVVWV